MTGKLDDYLNFNQTALNMLSLRQEVLASNIANDDTPHFQARDFDFAAALENKMKADPSNVPVLPMPGVGMVVTSSMHLLGKAPVTTPAKMGVALQYRKVDQPSLDGNTVDLDTERNQFAYNGLRYEQAVTAVNSQLSNLMSVIRGSD